MDTGRQSATGWQGLRAAQRKVMDGQTVEIVTELAEDTRWQAQDIPLNIVYEDEHLLVIDKPAGLVVHPKQVLQMVLC